MRHAWRRILCCAIFVAAGLPGPSYGVTCKSDLNHTTDRVRAARLALQQASSDSEVCMAAGVWDRVLTQSTKVYQRCLANSVRAEFMGMARDAKENNNKLLRLCKRRK